MIDLSRPWPMGLGEKRWWATLLVLLAALAVALAVDHPLSMWAQGWPEPVRHALAVLTRLGESDWILYPSGIAFIAAAAAAVLLRRPLFRLAMWQAAGVCAFVFFGVGAPSLFTTLVKRLIGRGRPMYFDKDGLLSFHWNWADWTYQSFPSGHATTAFALAMVLGFILPRWFYPALLYAVAICISRVVLGVHYPSDVTAGAIVGVLGAYCVRWIFARTRWLFARDPSGRIALRPPLAFERLRTLRRRGSAPARPSDRP